MGFKNHLLSPSSIGQTVRKNSAPDLWRLAYMIKSKALEVNLASYRVDVSIDDKYATLQDIMSRYYGLMEGFNTFLKELSHPYRNWNFIISEARRYTLEYFHLMDDHTDGPEGARLFVEIFIDAINAAREDGRQGRSCRQSRAVSSKDHQRLSFRARSFCTGSQRGFRRHPASER